MTFAFSRYAGVVLSPAAWAVSTQLGQITPYADCSNGSVWTPAVTVAAVCIATAGGLLSWRRHMHAVGRADRTTAYWAALSGFIFTFALVLQGAATWLLSPCQH